MTAQNKGSDAVGKARASARLISLTVRPSSSAKRSVPGSPRNAIVARATRPVIGCGWSDADPYQVEERGGAGKEAERAIVRNEGEHRGREETRKVVSSLSSAMSALYRLRR